MRFIKYYVPDFDDSEYSQDEVHAALKNGVVLCKLINAISPRNEVRINLGIFKNGEQMLQKEELENIGKFIDAALQFGVKQEDVCISAGPITRKDKYDESGQHDQCSWKESESKRETPFSVTSRK